MSAPHHHTRAAGRPARTHWTVLVIAHAAHPLTPGVSLWPSEPAAWTAVREAFAVELAGAQLDDAQLAAWLQTHAHVHISVTTTPAPKETR